VRSSLLAALGPTVELWVSGPSWQQLTIQASVVAEPDPAADFVGGWVVAALERFLHPLTGGFESEGWEFGRLPHRSDLHALLESLDGVDHVASLAIFVTDAGGALVDITESDGHARQELVATAPPHFLVYSGDHQIDVSSPSPALPAVSGP
jgi:hypothetical protein